MTKALVMFSGGLDSLLAIKILEQQNIDCTALTFTTPFFGKEKAERQSKKFGIKFMSVDISDPHFEILKNPKYGYGKNLNPCIDCHGFMFHYAGQLADEKGFDIIASGEVLGQRPMSQNKNSLASVHKLAGRDVLRPLSAKLLSPTIYEKNGLVDTDQLLSINGKGRKEQIKLAKEFGLEGYSAPGGGCLLTDPGYSKKLKTLLGKFPKDILPFDAEIIKYGFLYILERGFILIGRDQENNEMLIDFLKSNKIDKNKYKIVHSKQYKGPIAVSKIIKNTENFESDLKQKYRLRFKKVRYLDDFDLEYL